MLCTVGVLCVHYGSYRPVPAALRRVVHVIARILRMNVARSTAPEQPPPVPLSSPVADTKFTPKHRDNAKNVSVMC